MIIKKLSAIASLHILGQQLVKSYYAILSYAWKPKYLLLTLNICVEFPLQVKSWSWHHTDMSCQALYQNGEQCWWKVCPVDEWFSVFEVLLLG